MEKSTVNKNIEDIGENNKFTKKLVARQLAQEREKEQKNKV